MSQSKRIIYVIGGGTSLSEFDYNKLIGSDVIAVNKSIFAVPNCKYFVTMDHSFLMKVPMEDFHKCTKKTTKVFVASLAEDYMQEHNGQILDLRCGMVYNLRDFDVILKSRCSEGLGKTFKEFKDGANSGFCAIQFAALMGYDEIRVLGIDLSTTNSETHHHGGYGESVTRFKTKLDFYYSFFEKGLKNFTKKFPNVKLVSCSKNSRLNNLIEYKEIT